MKPFNTLVLVEKLDTEKKTAGGLYTPNQNSGFFSKFKVLAIGDLVNKVKVDSIVIGHDVMEPLTPGSNEGFMLENQIFAEVEK